MNKLIVLMIVLIPAAAFAAKDVSLGSMHPGRCDKLAAAAYGYSINYLAGREAFSSALEDGNEARIKRYCKVNDYNRKAAAEVAAVYNVFCK